MVSTAADLARFYQALLGGRPLGQGLYGHFFPKILPRSPGKAIT
jgi:hypothetical protein